MIWLTLLNKRVPNFWIHSVCDTAPMTWPFLHSTNKKILPHSESNFPTFFRLVSILRFSYYGILIKEMITGNDVLLHHTNIWRFNKFPKDSLECLVINEPYRYFSMAIPVFFSLWNVIFTDISLFPGILLFSRYDFADIVGNTFTHCSVFYSAAALF